MRVSEVLASLFDRFKVVQSAFVVVDLYDILDAITDYKDDVVEGN